MKQEKRIYCDEDMLSFRQARGSVYTEALPGDYSRVKTIPAFIRFSFPVTFGKGVLLGVGCVFLDSVHIGSHSRIAPFCSFSSEVTTGDRCVVCSNTHFAGRLSIGKACRFGAHCIIHELRGYETRFGVGCQLFVPELQDTINLSSGISILGALGAGRHNPSLIIYKVTKVTGSRGTIVVRRHYKVETLSKFSMCNNPRDGLSVARKADLISFISTSFPDHTGD